MRNVLNSKTVAILTNLFFQIQSREMGVRKVQSSNLPVPFFLDINGRYMVESCHRYTHFGGPVWNGLMDLCELILG